MSAGTRCRIEQGAAAHLLDAGGAGTGQPKLAGRKEALMTLLIPLDEDAVVPAVDGVGDGVHDEINKEVGAMSLPLET